MITDNSIKAVLAATNLPAVIGEYVSLSVRAGADEGLCPFHEEKRPSFKVFADHYHCFGCGAHGNAFEFLQQHVGLSFPDSVRMLASRAGIVLEESLGHAQPADVETTRQLDALRRACAVFQYELLQPGGAEAMQAVQARGLDSDSIARFGIGFAPSAWGTLTANSAFNADDLISTGLAVRRKSKSGSYDFFRNRLVFPVQNAAGQVVGFGGRLLGDGGPKYLNTEETAFYRKGKLLFGIQQARNAIRKNGFVVVAEGFFDVITPAQNGFENIVSTCGTALTEDQIELLFSLSNRIVFCFDGDTAGSKATWRSAEMMVGKLGDHHEVRLCTLPAKHDPDSFVREHGIDQFSALIDAAPTLSTYLADTITKGARIPESRARALIKAKALWRHFGSPVVATFFRQHICEKLNLSADEFEQLGSASRCVEDASLKECPFCPDTPLMEQVLDRWRVQCVCGIQTQLYPEVGQARAAWNRRRPTLPSENSTIKSDLTHELAT